MAETLCWSCRRPGTSTCQWDASKANRPVPGWTADASQMYISGGMYRDTFCVRECPLYIHDGRSNTLAGRLSLEDQDLMDSMLMSGARPCYVAREFGVDESTVFNRKQTLYMRRRKEK